MLALHCIPEVLYAENIDAELVTRVKRFPLRSNAYPQYIRYGQTEGRTVYP